MTTNTNLTVELNLKTARMAELEQMIERNKNNLHKGFENKNKLTLDLVKCKSTKILTDLRIAPNSLKTLKLTSAKNK